MFMSKAQLTTAIAVATGLVVITLFFIFNPFAMQGTPASSIGDVQNQNKGITVQDEVAGTGAEAVAGSQVSLNYTGKLQNGTVFDTSVGKAPLAFVLGSGQVIPGFDSGITGMKVGGKRIIIIPPELAYGPQAVGPIPPNSTLVFEVELLDVKAPVGQ